MACNGERIVTFKKRRDSLWSMYSDSSTEEDSQKPCKTELLGALDEGKTSHAYQYGSPSALQSLRGLRKLGVVARGSQGAIYAAKDRTRVGEVPGEEEEEEEECWRMVVVKRLYSRQNGYGRVGIDPTVLREPTILRYVHQQQQRLMRSGPKEKLSDHNNAGDNDRDGVFLTDPTMPSSTLIDETARVVELYRVVEAPFQELCLVLEACMTDLQELCVVSSSSTASEEWCVWKAPQQSWWGYASGRTWEQRNQQRAINKSTKLPQTRKKKDDSPDQQGQQTERRGEEQDDDDDHHGHPTSRQLFGEEETDTDRGGDHSHVSGSFSSASSSFSSSSFAPGICGVSGMADHVNSPTAIRGNVGDAGADGGAVWHPEAKEEKARTDSMPHAVQQSVTPCPSAKKTLWSSKTIEEPLSSPELRDNDAGNGTAEKARDEEEGEMDVCLTLRTLPVLRYLFRRILRIIAFLHDQCHVCHRDIKPSNFLVDSYGNIRLADFGSACLLPVHKSEGTDRKKTAASRSSEHKDTERAAKEESEASAPDVQPPHTPTTFRTTQVYAAPECILAGPYDESMDMWSAGVLFLELLFQRPLFYATSELVVLSEIYKLLSGYQADHEGTTVVPAEDEDPSKEQKQPEAISATDVLPSTRLTAMLTPVLPADGIHFFHGLVNVQPLDRLRAAEALHHSFLEFPGWEEEDAVGRQLWTRAVSHLA